MIADPTRLPRSCFPKKQFAGVAALTLAALSFAQTAPATAGTAPEDKDEEVVVLSPFTVDATQDTGYQATQTLAGTRIRTNLAEVGSAISVLTKELITDIGGFNNQTVLAYAVNTEVSGARGNFSGANRTGSEGHIDEIDTFGNANGATRVRGLTSADNTRDFFLTSIPWDGYNISRVDLQRGPNAILFGLGSPAGVINASTNQATFQNKGSVGAMFDEHGTQRYTLDYNRALFDKQLGIRVSLLDNNQKFQQRPAFSHDRRGFAAVKYAPSVLNKNGMLFTVSANVEHGEIDANRPRSVTPEDQISAFWRPTAMGGVNKRTFDTFRDMFIDNNSARNVDIQKFYAEYNPVTGNSNLGGLTTFLNSAGSTMFMNNGVQRYLTLRPNGTPILATSDTSGGVWAGQAGLRSLTGIPSWATNTVSNRTFNGVLIPGKTALPYAGSGQYRLETITDPSIFDFYNKLIDGPNKREWAHWNAYTANVTNTFFDNMVGYDLNMYKEEFDSGQWVPGGWDATAIKIDINERNMDGTPNPNVGRAYVGGRTVDLGSRTSKSNREAYRAQLFGEYNFAKRHSGIWATLLGEQRVTGVYSEEDQKSDSRSLMFATYDPAYMTRFGPPFTDGGLDIGQPSFRYYISGDLRGRAALEGANLTNVGMPWTNMTDTVAPMRWFDPTWTATNVNPGAAWTNPADPNNIIRASWTQSQNPANYRGWTETDVRYVTLNSRGKIGGYSAQDFLTRSGTLANFNVKSKVGVWQGAFWNRAIVGVYGYREDDARRYEYITSSRNRNGDRVTGGANLNPGSYNFDNPAGSSTDLTTTTRNWSVMLHVNKLLGSHDVLPVNIRLYYNQGENFQPAAGRRDVFSNPLPPPRGETTDKSIMISTKDDKYSVRVTQYETQMTEATSTDGRLSAQFALEQILGGNLGWGSSPSSVARGYLQTPSRFDPVAYTNSGGDYNRLMTQIIPSWMQFEKDLKRDFPDFVRAWMGSNTLWGTDTLTDYPRVGAPAGFTVTEDSISKGYELELVANPTKNWRLALNGSKTEAIRTNVPGPAFRSVLEYIVNKMETTDAGLIPIYWAQNTQGLRATGPYATVFLPDWTRVQAQNGQTAGEVRKYRANAITNYTFDTGFLKGFGVGAGYRWEDKSVIAYAPKLNPNNTIGINLNAPYYAPAEDNIDLWFSYSRKLSKDLRWRIQLNLFNVGGKDKLVPIIAGLDWSKTAVPGYTAKVGDVPPMKATGFSIRQGMSWQLSNTLEF